MLAMQCVKPGGLLLTCTCSQAMTFSGEFLTTVRKAATRSGREVAVLRKSGAAVDHVLNPMMPETEYLHTILLSV